MVLFAVTLVTDPVSIKLFYFVDPAVPAETQRAQFSILEMGDHLNGFKNIFKGHRFILLLDNIQTYTNIKYLSKLSKGGKK